MEAWKEELYHYGVRGMKWRHKKRSALAKEFVGDANDVVIDRDYRDSKKYKRWSMQKERAYRNTAKAIENGRPAPRRKFQTDFRPSSASTLKKRGPVSGTTARGKSKSSSGLQSGTYDKTRARAKKKRVTKFVKRVLQ